MITKFKVINIKVDITLGIQTHNLQASYKSHQLHAVPPCPVRLSGGNVLLIHIQGEQLENYMVTLEI